MNISFPLYLSFYVPFHCFPTTPVNSVSFLFLSTTVLFSSIYFSFILFFLPFCLVSVLFFLTPLFAFLFLAWPVFLYYLFYAIFSQYFCYFAFLFLLFFLSPLLPSLLLSSPLQSFPPPFLSLHPPTSFPFLSSHFLYSFLPPIIAHGGMPESQPPSLTLSLS